MLFFRIDAAPRFLHLSRTRLQPATLADSVRKMLVPTGAGFSIWHEIRLKDLRDEKAGRAEGRDKVGFGAFAEPGLEGGA
jgi:hypothetical protein